MADVIQDAGGGIVRRFKDMGDGTVAEVMVAAADILTPPPWSSAHIATATTTLVKTGAGTLHAVNINTISAGGQVTLYDSLTATGTVLAVIDTTVTQEQLVFDVAFLIGLTVKTTDGGITHADLTIAYV